uniref:Protein HGH1 homolog n=2 Tax=Clastoptera arizonana TaxID=38151 RepID=A0A1B6D1Q7_9HEMI
MENNLLKDFEEILPNLNHTTNPEVKYLAAEYILGFMDPTICKLICSNEFITSNFLRLLNDIPKVAVVGCKILINISADEEGASKLYSYDDLLSTSELKQDYKGLIPSICDFILNVESIVADAACMLLSNLTRSNLLASKCWSQLTVTRNKIVDQFLVAFCTISFNKSGCMLDYLGPVFSNLSQIKEFRCYLLNKKGCGIEKLLPFTEYSESIVRKGGVIGVLRNCSFDIEFHEQLLGPEIGILPRLLLPLAGPEEFDDEDNNKLPIDLQYLPDDKVREPDPDIRIMLLETLNQLCATKKGREFLRDHNAYLILRELHKWEIDRKALLACENVVDILIRTEDEIEVDNLQDLEVTGEMKTKFEKMDSDYIHDT